MSSIDQFLKHFIKENQFDLLLGLSFNIIKPGHIEYSLPLKPIHQSSPNFAHGGVMSGMMDAVLGLSALTLAFTENNLTSTVEFKINYLRPGLINSELLGIGEVIFNGKSLMVAQGKIIQKDNKKEICLGTGTFNKYPWEKKKDLYAL